MLSRRCFWLHVVLDGVHLFWGCALRITLPKYCSNIRSFCTKPSACVLGAINHSFWLQHVVDCNSRHRRKRSEVVIMYSLRAFNLGAV